MLHLALCECSIKKVSQKKKVTIEHLGKSKRWNLKLEAFRLYITENPVQLKLLYNVFKKSWQKYFYCSEKELCAV